MKNKSFLANALQACSNFLALTDSHPTADRLSQLTHICRLTILLLTLGTGQMWGGAGLYEVYFTYSYNGNNSNATYTNSTSSTQTTDLGTLTADFNITSLYLKYWKDNSGNMCGGLVDYYITSDQEYQPTWSWTDISGNNHQLGWSGTWTVAQYNSGNSGDYTFWYRFKTWGSSSSSSNCGDNNYYIPTNSNVKNKFTYSIAPPAVNGWGVTTSGYLAGSGTSADPYLVKSGNSLTFTVSGSKARTDYNSTFNYWLNSGSKQTSGTLSTGSITSTTTASAVIHGQCINNSSSSLVGTESTTTVYYKAVSVKDISVYIYVGEQSDAEAQSVEINSYTPYVGETALAAGRVNTYNSGSSPKFTKDGDWLSYTFEDVTKITLATCARAGGNIFTSLTLTDDVYYKFDGTVLSGKCVPYTTPTWNVAPANGAVGGSMTASINNVPVGATVTWSSTATSYATVNSSGLISYVAAGSATIKARIQKAASGDNCALDITLSQSITVTSGATVSVERTCAEYVTTESGQVTLHITSTGASTGWKYRIYNTRTAGYQSPDNVDASSNDVNWTMNGGIALATETYKVELYNGSGVKITESSTVSVIGETAHPITIAAGANGSVSPTSVSANSAHIHPTITATPNTGYNFVNWTYNNSNATVTTPTNSETTIATATGACTITANFAAKTTTVTLNKNGGESNSSVIATYGASLPSFSAINRTGYTLTGYWTAESGGTKVIDANGTFVANSGIWNRLDGNTLTLHAQWTEIMPSLTTARNIAAAAASNPSVAGSATTVGYATTRSIAAAAANTGYKLVGWTVTNGTRTDGGADDATTITVRANGGNDAVTVTANYAEDLTTTWYLEGDNTPFGGWTIGNYDD